MGSDSFLNKDSRVKKSRIDEANLKCILGLKLKQLRTRKSYSLKELSQASGLSISYLNEIEKGKKYPKADKTLALAEALDVGFDELVSMQLDGDLKSLSGLLNSDFLQRFPLDAFGVHFSSMMEMMSASPQRFSMLVDTFIDLARRFDIHLEHLNLAALRSYIEINNNFFPEMEEAAKSFREEFACFSYPQSSWRDYARLLVRKFKYRIDTTMLGEEEELAGVRSITVPDRVSMLFLHPLLSDSQRAFIIARELGYRYLGYKERLYTSPQVNIDSFEQILNNFKASYFASALMLDESSVTDDMAGLFAHDRLDGGALLGLMQKYKVTPELFFHRLSQLLPGKFGLQQMHFIRMHHDLVKDRFDITKELHLSSREMHLSKRRHYRVVGFDEHYCRRWMALRLLRRFKQTGSHEPIGGVQCMNFLNKKENYLCISVAQHLPMEKNRNSCISLSFSLNDELRSVMKFADNPSIPSETVNDTCERCSLSGCKDRVAPSSLCQREVLKYRRKEAIKSFIEKVS